MTTILVTGAGGAPAFNFAQSLRHSAEPFHLIGVDCDKYHLALAATDEQYLVPAASEVDYLPVLRSIISEHKIDFLFAQPDAEVAVISKARDSLGVATCLPAQETVEICQDKYRTHVLWRDAGIKQPYTRLVESEADLADPFAKFPQAWLRPRTGAAGRGSFLAQSENDARAWLYLNQGWGRFTCAEYLSPHSVTWQSLWDRGKLLVAQGRRRLYWEYGDRTPTGVTGITGGAVTVSDPDVDRIALRAIAAVDAEPHGVLSVDLTYDRDGVPNPTEINIGRFFTTQLFFTEAGLNMPYMLVKLGLGESTAGQTPIVNPLPQGLVWLRGMDRSPVLVSMDSIQELEAKLQERRREAAQVKEPVA